MKPRPSMQVIRQSMMAGEKQFINMVMDDANKEHKRLSVMQNLGGRGGQNEDLFDDADKDNYLQNYISNAKPRALP